MITEELNTLVTISAQYYHCRNLTPHCCWYQREGFVFLTVEVMDCQDPDISVMDDKLVFTCDGGESGKYELDVQLLHDINTKVGSSQLILTIISDRHAGVSLRRQSQSGGVQAAETEEGLVGETPQREGQAALAQSRLPELERRGGCWGGVRTV